MSIEMAGGVYCPLSPRDPKHRLHVLVEQTQSRLVLVHWMTRKKFNENDIVLDIEVAVNSKQKFNEDDLDALASVKVTPENMAYVIFTSGSTGTPKAVSLRLCFSGAHYCYRSLYRLKCGTGISQSVFVLSFTSARSARTIQ
jgi:surfactin family lipopeptide synthetase C